MPFSIIDNEVLPLLSQLIDLRLGRNAGHQFMIADMARRISISLDHEAALTREIYLSALLCHIGFMSLPDILIKTPYNALSEENRQLVDRSAVEGAAILASISFLNNGAPYVKHQYEYFSGKGYPDGLIGAEIPIGSRIIAIAVDFNDLQNGHYFGKRLTPQQAKSVIIENAGKKFDPEIVPIFVEIVNSNLALTQAESELVLPVDKLKPGMILTQDIMLNNGLILLRKGKTLSIADIAALLRVNKLYPSSLTLYIKEQKKM